MGVAMGVAMNLPMNLAMGLAIGQELNLTPGISIIIETSTANAIKQQRL